MKDQTVSSDEMFTRVCEVTDSTNISRIAYDPDNHTMKVDFNSGQSYLYFDVHYISFGTIISSSSVGKVFNEHLGRYNWPSKKIGDK